MTHPHGEEKGFARVVEFPDGASVYIGSLHVADFKLEIEQTHNPAWTPERAANNLAYQINTAHAARVRPLVEALEKIGRSCPDTISRLWAQKALEDFRNGK